MLKLKVIYMYTLLLYRESTSLAKLGRVEKSVDNYNFNVFREIQLVKTSLKFENEDKRKVIHG